MCLPSVWRVMYMGYWQLQVPAPVTSERSVAFDGLAEPELDLEPDELVCVGAAGGVDPVPEPPWVSEVPPTLADVDRAGVYVATTTRCLTMVRTGAESRVPARWLLGRREIEGCGR